MATTMHDWMTASLHQLRYEPTEKRVRAQFDGQTVVDSTRARLVWEPRRVVPSYAVPAADIAAELSPAEARAGSDAALLHPGMAFAAHSCPGTAFDLRVGDRPLPQAGFRPDDPDLRGYIVLDSRSFDAWFEEDELVRSHPRDPYHRVDIRRSSRAVRVESGGVLLAETQRARLLFETRLPVRFYIPQEDLRVALRPSSRRSYCPYKGEASYGSLESAGTAGADLAWSYREPLPDAQEIARLWAFFDERVDVFVDGELRARPATAYSRAILNEAGVPGAAREPSRVDRAHVAERGAMHHVDLSVSDLAVSRPFYEAVLGVMGYRLVRQDQRGFDFECATSPQAGSSCSIGIMQSRGEHARRAHDRYSPGLHHLAWRANSREDVARLHARLLEIGATVLDAPADYPEYGAGYHAVFFADPDGLKLELVYQPA